MEAAWEGLPWKVQAPLESVHSDGQGMEAVDGQGMHLEVVHQEVVHQEQMPWEGAPQEAVHSVGLPSRPSLPPATPHISKHLHAIVHRHHQLLLRLHLRIVRMSRGGAGGDRLEDGANKVSSAYSS